MPGLSAKGVVILLMLRFVVPAVTLGSDQVPAVPRPPTMLPASASSIRLWAGRHPTAGADTAAGDLAFRQDEGLAR